MKTINPFDRVLVRDANNEPWRIQLYSHPYGELHACLNGVYVQCVPYEGNERLLGTTDAPEPEFRKGDIVLVWDEGDTKKYIRVYSHFDDEIEQHMAYAALLRDGKTTEAENWDHAEKITPATVESSAMRS